MLSVVINNKNSETRQNHAHINVWEAKMVQIPEAPAALTVILNFQYFQHIKWQREHLEVVLEHVHI